MYIYGNPRTKKAVRTQVKAGLFAEDIYQPNNIFGVRVPLNGRVNVCGPQFPEAHRWYATLHLKDGKVVKIT